MARGGTKRTASKTAGGGRKTSGVVAKKCRAIVGNVRHAEDVPQPVDTEAEAIVCTQASAEALAAAEAAAKAHDDAKTAVSDSNTPECKAIINVLGLQPADELTPDALDQKGNRYYRRKLLSREFLTMDIMKFTFELPRGVSLRSLGFDAGLGDFVRMRPYVEDHRQLVQNPAGGRAYSPVLLPDVEGKFGVIIKAYGPEDEVVGMSSLLKHVPIGTELLITNHVEHVFWKDRNRGYYCNERTIDPDSKGDYSVGLIAFGIGITEVAIVAASELLDPRVKRVSILWANKKWSDTAWVCSGTQGSQSDDMIHNLFADQARYGDRLKIMHILSQEERPEASFHGRISPDVLREAFLADSVPQERLKCLAVGTTVMINSAYEMLADLGLDILMKDHWYGKNLLYRKVAESVLCTGRSASPLLAGTGQYHSAL